MFGWSILFFVVALCAAILGFGGVAASAAGAAKITFFVAIVLGIGSLLLGRSRGAS